jgi:hypothetical protein
METTVHVMTLFKPLCAVTALVAAALSVAAATSTTRTNQAPAAAAGRAFIHLVPPLAPAETPRPLPRVTET